mmetsp:Transcript_40187/g.89168  ORF Transcript_40187/g.89168 Transcript_40187/m.89168 type:complete len:355 (-) Transcript_40187:1290-2354(-)
MGRCYKGHDARSVCGIRATKASPNSTVSAPSTCARSASSRQDCASTSRTHLCSSARAFLNATSAASTCTFLTGQSRVESQGGGSARSTLPLLLAPCPSTCMASSPLFATPLLDGQLPSRSMASPPLSNLIALLPSASAPRLRLPCRGAPAASAAWLPPLGFAMPPLALDTVTPRLVIMPPRTSSAFSPGLRQRMCSFTAAPVSPPAAAPAAGPAPSCAWSTATRQGAPLASPALPAAAPGGVVLSTLAAALDGAAASEVPTSSSFRGACRLGLARAMSRCCGRPSAKVATSRSYMAVPTPSSSAPYTRHASPRLTGFDLSASSGCSFCRYGSSWGMSSMRTLGLPRADRPWMAP